MQKTRLCVVLIVLMAVSASCASMQGISGVWTNLSPMQKSTMFNDTYRDAFDDYMRLSQTDGNFSETFLKAMAVKKKALTEVYPLVQTYADYAGTGSITLKHLEPKILKLLTIATGG